MKRPLLAAALALSCAAPSGAALFKSKPKPVPAPVRAVDPLAPLSADELTLAVTTVREAGVFGSSAAFALAALHEPAKGEPAAGRRAKLVVVDEDRKETSEAVVDLKEKRLTSWRLLVNVAPDLSPFTPRPPEPAPAYQAEPGAAPVTTTEIEVDGHRVRWDKWRLRAFAHPREGLVISEASFDGRHILARASASEIARLVSADGQGGDLKFQLIEADLGFGRRARPLEPKVDVPADSAFLDAAFVDDAGKAFTVKRAVALYPRRSLGAGREAVLRAAFVIEGREYSQLWILRQNGELEARVEVLGSTSAVENHFFSYRVDLDVDGSTSAVSELGLVPSSGRPLAFAPQPLRTTLESRRDAAPTFARRWLAASAVGAGGYALVPGEGSPVPAVDPRRAAFLAHAFWALPYNADRLYAAGEYPASGKPDGLDRWCREDEPLEGRDLVFWHTFGAGTLPSPGGRPLAGTAGFKLQPWGPGPSTN